MRWGAFEVGGIVEEIPGGADPTSKYREMEALRETRLGMAPGELDQQINGMLERLDHEGKNGAIGTLSEEEWLDELRRTTDWDQPLMDEYLRDFWDVYCG